MSIQENSPKPRISVTSSRNQDDLADLELPERSRLKIIPNPLGSEGSLKGSQNQEIDEEFFTLELLPDSHIMSKQNATANSTQTFLSLKNDSRNQSKNVVQTAEQTALKESNKSLPKKNLAEIPSNAVEKSKRTSIKFRGSQQDQNFNDNNQASECLQNDEQMDIRKRIEEKVRNGYNHEKQGGGLKAKAQQLRRQNQLRQRILHADREFDKKSLKQAQQKTEMKQAFHQPKDRQTQKTQNKIQENKTDNNLDNMNKKLESRPSLFELATREVTLAQVIFYYQAQFEFNESDISNELIGRSKKQIQSQEQQSNGFSFCACFRPKSHIISNYNIAIAKRLVAISRHKVTNTREQQHLLRQIWASFTKKEFVRYGPHWIELGFQGKDPFTDLRSTGILSLLQWIQFIQAHPKVSQQYYIWSLSHYFPMALTFIQITDIFLDLLSKGAIKSQNWEEFQRCYNCLVMGMFQKIIEKLSQGGLVPNFVQNQANELKSQFKSRLASYNQEYKRIR